MLASSARSLSGNIRARKSSSSISIEVATRTFSSSYIPVITGSMPTQMDRSMSILPSAPFRPSSTESCGTSERGTPLAAPHSTADWTSLICPIWSLTISSVSSTSRSIHRVARSAVLFLTTAFLFFESSLYAVCAIVPCDLPLFTLTAYITQPLAGGSPRTEEMNSRGLPPPSSAFLFTGAPPNGGSWQTTRLRYGRPPGGVIY
mmetsp:Transcript_38506/g.87500  ORF Transcript_38506/g.87500 Transcript_38506/m.87500 type:complete len:204 (-) Transcript_38506:1498-2109(-)